MTSRFRSIHHAEYEILSKLRTGIDLNDVYNRGVPVRRDGTRDPVANKRAEAARANIRRVLENMLDVRKSKLPHDHLDFEVKA